MVRVTQGGFGLRRGKMTIKDRKSRGYKANQNVKQQGYLLISTIFLLFFTALFSQSMIRISASQLVQLQQVATAYQAKTALNISEKILMDYIANNGLPNRGEINTSNGIVKIEKKKDYLYELTLIQANNDRISKDVIIEFQEVDNEVEDVIENSEDTEDVEENIVILEE